MAMKPENISPQGLETLQRCLNLNEALTGIDNRKLVWLINQSKLGDFDIGSPEDALVMEIMERLYPEYDGETVYATNRGWQTPEGEIIYIEDHSKEKRE